MTLCLCIGITSHFTGYSFGTQDTIDAGFVGEVPVGGAFHQDRFRLHV